MKWYYSVDIGGTFVKFGKIDETGMLQHTWKMETKSKDAHDFYDRVAMQIDEAAYGIGVCAPGIFDEEGIILTKSSGHASCLYQTSPIKELEKRLHVPVSLINDAKACGLCELKLGAAKGTNRSACYVIGTGIGGCLMDETGIQTGANGFSGEFSYMPIYSENGIKQLGNEASMTALLHHYQTLHPEVSDTFEIMKRYHEKESDATQVVYHWINAIAMQLITIHSIYDPALICIGGAISSQSWVIEEIKKQYQTLSKSFISPTLPDHTIICSCLFQGDANLIGAYLHFLNTKGK